MYYSATMNTFLGANTKVHPVLKDVPLHKIRGDGEVNYNTKVLNAAESLTLYVRQKNTSS
jgi:hypothetical protein